MRACIGTGGRAKAWLVSSYARKRRACVGEISMCSGSEAETSPEGKIYVIVAAQVEVESKS